MLHRTFDTELGNAGGVAAASTLKLFKRRWPGSFHNLLQMVLSLQNSVQVVWKKYGKLPRWTLSRSSFLEHMFLVARPPATRKPDSAFSGLQPLAGGRGRGA